MAWGPSPCLSMDSRQGTPGGVSYFQALKAGTLIVKTVRMTRLTSIVLAASLLLAVGCGGDDDPAIYEATLASCHLKVTPSPDPIPLNETFALTVAAYDLADRSAMLKGVNFSVFASMPQHGHGMNVQPKQTKTSDGALDVQGMLFHMPGQWELVVGVAGCPQSDPGAQPEKVVFQIPLEP